MNNVIPHKRTRICYRISLNCRIQRIRTFNYLFNRIKPEKCSNRRVISRVFPLRCWWLWYIHSFDLMGFWRRWFCSLVRWFFFFLLSRVFICVPFWQLLNVGEWSFLCWQFTFEIEWEWPVRTSFVPVSKRYCQSPEYAVDVLRLGRSTTWRWPDSSLSSEDAPFRFPSLALVTLLLCPRSSVSTAYMLPLSVADS